MRTGLVLCGLLFLSGSILSQDRPRVQELPDHFEIGRHYFLDFGPPTDFYELFLVHTKDGQTFVEKIILTPSGDKCVAPASVEVKTAALADNIPELLGKTSPCAIPKKELNRELKRCKKCMVFSGAEVTMQVECGARTRLIRSDILDRDMFDPASKTPEHTSWTMHLLEQLDAPMGPGVLERPMFSNPSEKEGAQGIIEPLVAQEISNGKYDALFPKAPDKLSQLYRETLLPPPSPTVQLLNSSPIAPTTFTPPRYPPIARLAHVEGEVTLKIEIDENGIVSNVFPEGGNPMLQGAAKDASYGWKFPKGRASRETEATVKFALNCPRTADSKK
ncbi:MAG: TonB family protein [Candidatus Acidiferrum sp.]